MSWWLEEAGDYRVATRVKDCGGEGHGSRKVLLWCVSKSNPESLFLDCCLFLEYNLEFQSILWGIGSDLFVNPWVSVMG